MANILALSQAPHASAYNGGSTSTARQYWLRPTQRTYNGPRIASAVSGMAAGEFRTVWADAADFVFNVRSPENGALIYNTLDWTPRAAWDAATEQIVVAGKRIKFKVIAYSDLTGDWRELPMPLDQGASRASETGHWYGNTDEDGSGNVYLGFGSRHFKLNPATEAYTSLPTHETTNGANGAMYAWSDDLFTAGGLVRYAGDAQRWLRYNPATNAWDRPAQGLGNGMHALLEYQPTCARWLLVGGSLTTQAARLVAADGSSVSVTSAPDPIDLSAGSWIVAHPSGCWLVTTFGASRKLWAVWPNGGLTDVTWQDLGAAPDAALTYPTAAWDAARGLVYIVATAGLYAYKPTALSPPAGVQADFTASRTVMAAVAQDFAGTRGLLDGVVVDLAAARSILAAVQQDFASTREIEAPGQVSSDFTGARTLLLAVHADFSAAREIEAPLSVLADFSGTRAIYAVIYADFAASRLLGDLVEDLGPLRAVLVDRTAAFLAPSITAKHARRWQ